MTNYESHVPALLIRLPHKAPTFRKKTLSINIWDAFFFNAANGFSVKLFLATNKERNSVGLMLTLLKEVTSFVFNFVHFQNENRALR